MSRGFTLVELAVGIVTAAVLALVTSQLFRVGIVTYRATVRQDQALSVIRQALGSQGSQTGIGWESRGARSVQNLSATSLSVAASSTSVVVTSFTVTGGALYKTRSGVTTKLADTVASIAVNYYNLDSSGRIFESTSAVAAELVTVRLTMSAFQGQKDYQSFTGALLRNHP